VACDEPVGLCLQEHIRPKAPDAWDEIRRDEDTGRWYFMARCPGHDDSNRSLKVSQGKERRVVWFCHAGCSERKVRHALIDLGVHFGCLPRAAAEMRDLEETLRSLLTSDLSHADVRLRALALLDSPDGKLPAGAALEELASAVHVSRSGAFRARGAGPDPTTR
jgi:hypothetical protein